MKRALRLGSPTIFTLREERASEIAQLFSSKPMSSLKFDAWALTRMRAGQTSR